MTTKVSKSKKTNLSTVLQDQIADAYNSRKSARISSVDDNKVDSNNNAGSDIKATKKSRRRSDSGHLNDEENDEESSNDTSASISSNEENEHHNSDESPKISGDIDDANDCDKSPCESFCDDKGDISPEDKSQHDSDDDNKIKDNLEKTGTKSTLPDNAYLSHNVENAFHLAGQEEIAGIASHMSSVLKDNKRNKDLLCAIQGLFDKGYWRCEFDRNEAALRRLFTSNNVTVSESVWSNNHMLSLVEAASKISVQTTDTLSGGGNRREIKPLIQFSPSQAQIVAIQHELDQPSSGLTNKEIMSGQFADRFEIKLNQSKLADNPPGLISEKIEKFYQQDLYTSKEIIECLKHFLFNKKDGNILSISQ
jgi:hypothetical protein